MLTLLMSHDVDLNCCVLAAYWRPFLPWKHDDVPEGGAPSLVDAYEIRGDLVWPSELVLPPRPPAVVYLDQNHFVNMARIVAGKSASGYAELLQACRKSLREGRAIFPLSATHLMETAAISSSFLYPHRPQLRPRTGVDHPKRQRRSTLD